MRTLKAVDTDVRKALLQIEGIFYGTNIKVKKLPISESDTRGYMFTNELNNMCVITVPKGLSRNIITVANSKRALGVTVPKYVKGDVYAYLRDHIVMALDSLSPGPCCTARQIQNTLRG